MKVGIISIGALGHYCYCLSNALEDVGVEVVLYTDDRYDFDRFPTKFKLYKCMGKTSNFFSWYKKLLKQIEEDRLNLLHFQSYRKYLTLDTYLLYKIWHRFKLPLFYTIHDLFTFHGNMKSYITTIHHYPLLKYVYFKMFGGFIAHSKTAKEAFSCLYRVDEDRIGVISHGIMDCYDLGNYNRDSARAKLGLDENNFILLYFGNIGRRKGLEYLIRAYEILKMDHQHIKLLIAGNGREYYERNLKPLTNETGIVKYNNLSRVPIEDIELLFKASDLVVLPYVESSTSGNVKIATAFRKPVIATDVGEFPEVSKKYPIQLVKSMDISAIVDAVRSSLVNMHSLTLSSVSSNDDSWTKVALLTARFYENCREEAHRF